MEHTHIKEEVNKNQCKAPNIIRTMKYMEPVVYCRSSRKSRKGVAFINKNQIGLM